MANIISRLKLESGEFDSKIKRAGQELLAYSEHCKKMGLQMGYANRDAKEFAKALGSMQTVSQTARGKINELSEAFVNAKVMYKNMTDEEKKSVFGKNLTTSLDQLKVRLNAAKQDLADVNKELAGSGGGKFGEFGNVIDTLGQKLGLTTNATELLTSKTALMYAGIGAGVAVVTKATDALTKYNAELSKQDQVTQVTTGLKGPDANRMTDVARAMVDTYKVDFREAINAANTLMTQFGTTGDEAMKLIKDGMQGMIQGDGPKLLTMIQQYAPAFRDAGISASQLVAVIQNSEGGIFTDQNMNAIVMGIKNIRLMTKATSDALARLGIDGQKMSKKLSDGTLTIFEALKQVSGQLKNTEAGSQAAGEVMQQVFGRQGVTAGTNLAKAIETLNTNLDETKRQTGELGDAFAELQTANEKLNTAIREAFSYDGWEQMATGIKSKLITALATVIEKLGEIRQWFSDFTPSGQTENIQTAEQKDMNRRLAYVRSGNNKQYWNQQNKEYYDQQVSERQFKVSALKGDDSITRGLRQKAEADLKAWENLRDEYNKKANDILTAPPKGTTNQFTNPANPKTTINHTKEEEVIPEGSVKALTQQMQELKKAQDLVTTPDAWRKYQEQIDEITIKIGQMTGKIGSLKPGDIQTTGLGSLMSNQNFTSDSKSIGGLKLTLDDKAVKAVTEGVQKSLPKRLTAEQKIEGMRDLVGGINNVLSGIQQIGIDIPEEISKVMGVLNGIFTVVTGIQSIITVGQFLGIFHRGGVVPHAADGYFVGGNRYSGDTTPIMANAGELVLNKSSQNNLASDIKNAESLVRYISAENNSLSSSQQQSLAGTLQDGGLKEIRIRGKLSGEDIVLSADNWGKRTGKGELVWWRR
jgi:hypothetical protein